MAPPLALATLSMRGPVCSVLQARASQCMGGIEASGRKEVEEEVEEEGGGGGSGEQLTGFYPLV